jgi:Uma2 family endonuclease
MGLPQIKSHLSPQDYYRIERDADWRSEYFDGEMFAMAGGSPMHSLVKSNVITSLNVALRRRGSACRTFDSDLRVRVPKTGLRTYPDASVICGPLTYDDDDDDDDAKQTVTNPTLVVEVLSPSIESYDRGTKFSHYQSIPSLKQFVLVSLASVQVETFLRMDDGTWQYSRVFGAEAAVALDLIEVSIPLSEIYQGVEFEGTTVLRVVK